LKLIDGREMPRVNFREIVGRFDGYSGYSFHSCDVRLPGPGGAYRISFYPWWEHPRHLEAVAKGETEKWDAVDLFSGEIILSIYPVGVWKMKVEMPGAIFEWGFVEDGLAQWEFEDDGAIFCNRAMTFEEWQPIGQRITEKLKERYTYLPSRYNYAEIPDFVEYGYSSSFMLGRFPYTLFQLVRSALMEFDVPIFIPREPEKRERPVILRIGEDCGDYSECDYIIADDFEVEFPEIVHKPEWYVRKGE
jgi:hypothetical protein